MIPNEALHVIERTMGSVKGWECITPVGKVSLNKLQNAIDQLWKERDDIIDQGLDAGELDHELIEEYAKTARILEGML